MFMNFIPIVASRTFILFEVKYKENKGGIHDENRY